MNDTELKQLLAKMLPEKLKYVEAGEDVNQMIKTLIPRLYWKTNKTRWLEVLDTELLICQLVLGSLTGSEFLLYFMAELDLTHPWQKHTEVLAKVKGLI